MAMEANIPQIIDIIRFGSRGWMFTAVWKAGKVGEFKRQFRTSRSGRGLEAYWAYGGWKQIDWLDPRYKWPTARVPFGKQVRIVMRGPNQYDRHH